jgi:transcriptional regulator with XRE-family HTH domain
LPRLAALTEESSRRFGGLVRATRETKNLSLAELSVAADTSSSHLSRLERGLRPQVAPDTIAAIAAALSIDPVDFVDTTGMIYPEVQRALADRDLALALADSAGQLPYRTTWLLRRLHLAELARRHGDEPTTGAVDIAGLLAQHATFEVIERGDRTLEIHAAHVVAGGPNDAERRFLLGHALAHFVLEGEHPKCSYGLDAPLEQEDRERSATALASFLLVPPGALGNAVREAAPSHRVWWQGETGALIEAVASRLGVPAWLAARRIGEESLFAEAAELVDI